MANQTKPPLMNPQTPCNWVHFEDTDKILQIDNIPAGAWQPQSSASRPGHRRQCQSFQQCWQCQRWVLQSWRRWGRSLPCCPCPHQESSSRRWSQTQTWSLQRGSQGCQKDCRKPEHIKFVDLQLHFHWYQIWFTSMTSIRMRTKMRAVLKYET